MRPEAKKLLWDVQEAASKIELFIANRSLADYLSDAMLRSAVERQLEIIGEACSRLTRVDEAVASRIPEIPSIIAFRNVLAHGYTSVDDRLVWDIVTSKLPLLVSTVQRLLQEP